MSRNRIGPASAGTILALLLATASGCDQDGTQDPTAAQPQPPTSTATEPLPGPQPEPATPNPATSTDPPGEGSDAYEQAVRLVDCMRTNGIPDFPDPNPDGTFNMNDFAGLDMAMMQQVFLDQCSEFSLGRH